MGQLPVGMRQYLAHLILYPPSDNVAWAFADAVVIWGDWTLIGTMGHEFTHVSFFVVAGRWRFCSPKPQSQILDNHALSNLTSETYYSLDAKWQSEQNKDSRMPSDYAKTAWPEDFAEVGRLMLSELFVSGGLKSINKNSDQIKPSVEYWKKLLKAIILPSKGVCTAKAQTSPPVATANGAEIKDWPRAEQSVPAILLDEAARNSRSSCSMRNTARGVDLEGTTPAKRLVGCTEGHSPYVKVCTWTLVTAGSS
jgi:hypothetical protein